MSSGITGQLLNGGLWRSALAGFRALSRDGNLDPPVPNLPLETPADGVVRGLASATGAGSASAVGTLGAPIPAAAFVSRAQLRARKKIRRARATGNATANAVAAGYFLSSARAEATGSGASSAVGTGIMPAARPHAQAWIIF